MLNTFLGLLGLMLMVVVVLALAALVISPLLFVRYRQIRRSNASLESRMLLQIASR